MGFGVFDWMKDRLRGVLDMLNAMEASGELEVWAKAIADNILIGLEAIWGFGAASVELWQTFFPVLQSAADALGGWRNLALAVMAIPFRGVILGAVAALFQFAGGAALAMKALGGIGFGSAISGVLGFGKALLALANPLNWIKGAFIALRVALISTGIGALVVGLAMAGVWIYNNWSGLKSFFKGFGEAFMKSLGPARPMAEGVIRVVKQLWAWIARLLAPLDASAEQWAEWGRAAGRWTGEALAKIQDFFARLASWFTGGTKFDLANLFTPLAWGAALIPFLTLATFRKYALGASILGVKALITPLKWGAKLVPRLWPSKLLKLATGGAKLLLSALIMPLKWSKALIAKVPWFTLANGGKLFRLATLIKPILWTARLIPGIGWLALAGGLLWSLLIKPIDWGHFEWLKFEWSDILPDWNWDFINPIDLASKISLTLSKIGSPAGAAAAAKANTTPKKPVYHGTTPMIPRITEKARGGSFGPGWLLTGEEGPELEYKSRGGFIAHNKALRNMASMSEKISRGAANSSRAPSWLKGAAVASSMAASAAMPTAASELGNEQSSGAPVGSKYLTQNSRSNTSVSAPITLTIQGNVDQSVMPDLKDALADLEERLAARIEDEAHGSRRREHG